MVQDYYSIITKKFILRTSHTGWLYTTRELYNEVLSFYYHLLLEHPELCDMNAQKILRALEQMTIVGRDKKPVLRPLPWDKVPLYFRRAAINEGIAAGKSYLARERQEAPTETFSSGITLYKGMYKDLDSCSISIKVYDGAKWRWIRCRLSGNQIPALGESMSPRVVFKEKCLELHIPVRCGVSDGRKLKERMDAEFKICSLQFANGDAIAVCCVMDYVSEVRAVKFIRGGRKYQSRCQNILCSIEQSKEDVGGKTCKGFNKKYWKKLQNIHGDMAHQVSRKIMKFCQSENVSVIILPKYSAKFTKIMMAASGSWSPLQLSQRIVENLYYKAWHAGMLVVEVEASDISRFCAVCGSKLKRDGESFVCDRGHQGNRHLNSARNLGKKFIKNMEKHMP